MCHSERSIAERRVVEGRGARSRTARGFRAWQCLALRGVVASLQAQAGAPADDRSHIHLTFLDCSSKASDVNSPVREGRNQDALLIGFNGFTLRQSAMMIAGTLPFSGFTASIVYYPQDQSGVGPKSLVEIPARVQGDAYYATGIPRGTARLRISTDPRGGRWLEFRIGAIGVAPARRDVAFNVSAVKVEKAITAPIVTCHPQRNGPATCSS